MPAFYRNIRSLLHTEKHSSDSFAVKRLRRRILLYSCTLIALFAAGTLLTRHIAPKMARQKLESLACELIAHEFSDNSLSLHYSIRDPERYALESRYGLDCSQISLPVYTDASPSESEAFYSNFMTELSKINPEWLSEHDRFVYRILEDSLNSTISRLSLPFYGEPLSPSSGEQTSLLILLAEYRMETCRDVENYLSLLSCVGDYFDGLLLYEQQKADAGLFMSDSAVSKVIAQCDTLCTEEQLAQKTHFLQSTFRSRIQKLVDSGICSKQDARQYLAQNEALLMNVVSPAYERLADGLFLLKGSGHNADGLCHFEQGSLYYQTLLASSTGSSRSPEEIMALLTENFASDYDALCSIAFSLQDTLPDSAAALGDTPSLLLMDSPERMVEDLRARMAGVFPALPRRVSYEIKPVDNALCEYTSPAFYMVPAIDDYINNSIYINYGNEPDALTLYTTLAHEGYPGHLYQSVYHLCGMDESALLPLEGILSYGGYVEGWATYVEDLSYEYAAQAINAQNNPAYSPDTVSALCDFYRIDRRIQLCLYSILDLSIHYYGMTRDEAHALLGAYGVTDENVTNAIYEYIVEEPANYLKYYLGYLEIVSLKDTAKRVWGDGYSDLRFHTFFLQCGPAPFSLLEEALSELTFVP